MAGTGSDRGILSRLWHFGQTMTKVFVIAKSDDQAYASAMKTALFADFFSILALVGFITPMAFIIDGLITIYVYYKLGSVGIFAGSTYLIEFIPGLDALPMFSLLVLDHYSIHGAGSLGESTKMSTKIGAGLTTGTQEVSFYQIVLIFGILALILAAFTGVIPGGTIGTIVVLVLSVLLLFLVTGIMGSGNFTFTFNKLILALIAIALIMLTFLGLIPGGPIGNIIVVMYSIFILLWVFGVIGGAKDSFLKICITMLISFVVLAIIFGMISPSLVIPGLSGGLQNLPGQAAFRAGELQEEVIEEAPTLLARSVKWWGNVKALPRQWWDRQYAIATGGYYQGQVDKYADKDLGVFLKNVEAGEKTFYLGADIPIQVFADIEGESLEVDNCEDYRDKIETEKYFKDLKFTAQQQKEYYQNLLYKNKEECQELQTIKLSCNINNKRISGTVKPDTLDLFDIQGGGTAIDCNLPASRLKKGAEIVDIRASFPFVTKSYIKTYFMDIERLRNMKRQKLDPLNYFKILDRSPDGVYTGGPIMVGLGIKDELPLSVNTNPKLEQKAYRLGITLENKWNGKISEIRDLSIILPKEIELVCPLFNVSQEDANIYNLNLLGKKQIISQAGITGVKTYNCRIRAKNAVAAKSLLNNIPLVTKYIKVIVRYKYELEDSASIKLKQGNGLKADLNKCDTYCVDYDGCYCNIDCEVGGFLLEVSSGNNCNGLYHSYEELVQALVRSGAKVDATKNYETNVDIDGVSYAIATNDAVMDIVGLSYINGDTTKVTTITVTKNQVINYIKNNGGDVLKDYGATFYDAGIANGIDPAFGIAIARQESSLGKTGNLAPAPCYNFFGLTYNAVKKYGAQMCDHRTRFAKFSNPAEGIEIFFKYFKNLYVPKAQESVSQLIAPLDQSSGDYYCKQSDKLCYCCDTMDGYESWLINVPKFRSEVAK